MSLLQTVVLRDYRFDAKAKDYNLNELAGAINRTV